MYDIIMCSSPLNRKGPDSSYQEEYDAAKQLTNVHLFDIHNVNSVSLPKAEGKKLIYHGWMMPPAYYEKFYNNCKALGYELINTPEQYKACHWFNGWYESLIGLTPKSLIIPRDYDIRTMMEHVAAWMEANQCAVIIKDYVKSLKHDWYEACFIPQDANAFQITKVLAKFVALKEEYNDFQGNLVVRKFVDLKKIGIHERSGMPLSKEYRTFVIDNELLPTYKYWDHGGYKTKEGAPSSFIENIADKIYAGTGSKLFTIDVAQLEDGNWTCIEVGDGQVSAIPDGVDKLQFFRNLLK